MDPSTDDMPPRLKLVGLASAPSCEAPALPPAFSFCSFLKAVSHASLSAEMIASPDSISSEMFVAEARSMSSSDLHHHCKRSMLRSTDTHSEGHAQK